MKEHELQDFWFHQPLKIHQRSRLYPLKPIGIGTSGVESLTSYITRLSATHQVTTGVFLVQEVLPLINQSNDRLDKRLNKSFFHVFLGSTAPWNGIGSMALTPAEILSELTTVPDLKFLTLLTWSSVLASKGLLRDKKAWCPLCYDDWEQNGIEIHEPILWSVQAITTCPKHQQVLLDVCPNCSMINFPLELYSRAGFCSRCHHWLGNNKNSLNPTLTSDYLEWQTFVVQQVGNILAAAPTLQSLPKSHNIKEGINLCITSATNGQMKHFADLMYLGYRVPFQWRNGHDIPQLDKLLRVCYRLSIPLLNFLTGKVTIQQPLILNPLPICQQFKKTYRPFDFDKIQKFLEDCLNSEPPLSLSELASRIQYHPRNLTRYFPKICQQISARYKSYKRFVRRLSV